MSRSTTKKSKLPVMTNEDVNQDAMRKLEWCWGMDCGTLNIDTESNQVLMNEELYEWYKQGGGEGKDPGTWIWLPDGMHLDSLAVLYFRTNRAREASRHDIFEAYKGTRGKFLYAFLATPEMRQQVDVSYDTERDNFRISKQEAGTGGRTRTWLSCTMHVPPHFAIVNAGVKLDRFVGRNVADVSVYQAFFKCGDLQGIQLHRVHRLYRTWMSANPPADWLNTPATQSHRDKDLNPLVGAANGSGTR